VRSAIAGTCHSVSFTAPPGLFRYLRADSVASRHHKTMLPHEMREERILSRCFVYAIDAVLDMIRDVGCSVSAHATRHATPARRR